MHPTLYAKPSSQTILPVQPIVHITNTDEYMFSSTLIRVQFGNLSLVAVAASAQQQDPISIRVPRYISKHIMRDQII